MANPVINGVERPLAFNMRALRLFKERTGEALLSYINKLQGSSSDDAMSEAAGLLIMDEPEKLSALIWALVNGPQGAEVPFDEIESALDLETLPAVMVAISEEIARKSPQSSDQPEGNDKATTEAGTSTSAPSGPSGVAA